MLLFERRIDTGSDEFIPELICSFLLYLTVNDMLSIDAMFYTKLTKVFFKHASPYHCRGVFVIFPRVLLRRISGPILLIWDSSPIHRAKEIKALLKRGAALVNAGTWCSTLRKQDMTGFRFMR